MPFIFYKNAYYNTTSITKISREGSRILIDFVKDRIELVFPPGNDCENELYKLIDLLHKPENRIINLTYGGFN